jgi:hypothetical protein
MASIVSEGANFRKTDFACGEFCDEPMAQVHPEPTVSNGGFRAVNASLAHSETISGLSTRSEPVKTKWPDIFFKVKVHVPL